MLTGSHYFIKYPYASDTFQQSLKDDLDKAGEIPKLENPESPTKKDKQILEQANFVLRSLDSIFRRLSDSLFPFLENIFKFGINKSSEESTEISLSKKIGTELDRIFQLNHTRLNQDNNPITDAGSNPQSALSEELISTTEEQKLHGKGLVMNFLRDYVLERNFLQLAHENITTDTTGTSWTSCAVSLTGDHTKAVNSDAYQEPKNSPQILGLVADGVSICPNPVDNAEIARIKDEVQDELILEGQDDPSENMIDELKKKDSNSYGSHYFSKLLSQSVNEFVLPPSIIINENNTELSDLEAIDTAQELVKNPNIFWNKILYEVINDVDRDSIDRNFFTAIADYLETNPLMDRYPGLDLALRNKTVQQFLIAALPLSQFNLDATGEIFAKIFNEKDKSISSATHLSYAMDLGDKIALVQIGDSPIKALDEQGAVIDTNNNFSFLSSDKINLDKITGDISITLDRTQNPDQEPIIEVSNRVVIELVDKAKIAYIVIASDGIENKQCFSQRINDIFGNQKNLSSKEVINKALELSTDTDDRTMVVVKKNP